jgi:hypothetical protein
MSIAFRTGGGEEGDAMWETEDKVVYGQWCKPEEHVVLTIGDKRSE